MTALLLALLMSSQAQEPSLSVDAGCVIVCGDEQHLVTGPGVYTDRARYQALVEGTRAAEECLPGLHSALEHGDAQEAARAKQERLTRRARMQRNALGLVLGGVVAGVVVAVAID